MPISAPHLGVSIDDETGDITADCQVCPVSVVYGPTTDGDYPLALVRFLVDHEHNPSGPR